MIDNTHYHVPELDPCLSMKQDFEKYSSNLYHEEYIDDLSEIETIRKQLKALYDTKSYYFDNYDFHTNDIMMQEKNFNHLSKISKENIER